MKKYNILIPAYNASETIEELINQLFKLGIKPENIIIVNDGSLDETSSIAKDLNVNVIDLQQNMGKGAALIKGFDYFLQNTKADFLICMDADLQHPVNSIPDFLQKNTKFVIGNRKKSLKTMPFHRILSNVITSKILSFVIGQKILDSQCGYRMIHRDVICNIELKEKGFQLESEIVVETAKMNVKIDFVDIPTIYNQSNSNINNVKDTIRFVRYVTKEMFKRIMRLYYPDSLDS
jgi:glycosyltransferase involved in cell wall biosynthesis